MGKTWLMKEFGSRAYSDTIYINFDSNSQMAGLFASDLNTDRLIMGIELYAGRKIDPHRNIILCAPAHYWALLWMRVPRFPWER